jgi:hypothetical protein
MFALITACIETASHMVEPEYDAVAVQRHCFTALGILPGFIKQAENSQLARTAWSIQNKGSRATLPLVFNTETEAKLHMGGMSAAGMDIAMFEVVAIRVALMTGAPPRALPPSEMQRNPTPIRPPADPTSFNEAVDRIQHETPPPFDIPEAPLVTENPNK